MFHVKHSHKRKFLRIGRILQRCGRFACAASSAARDAASAFGDAASAFGDAASAFGDAASAVGGATSPGGDATSPGGDATSPGGGAVSGVGRPPAFRVREAPNGFHCGESAARGSCACSCSGVFHNPRPSHRRLCRKLPTCVVGLHRADSARRLSRSVGFALEKMANGG